MCCVLCGVVEGGKIWCSFDGLILYELLFFLMVDIFLFLIVFWIVVLFFLVVFVVFESEYFMLLCFVVFVCCVIGYCVVLCNVKGI